jgi:hypothetical protein
MKKIAFVVFLVAFISLSAFAQKTEKLTGQVVCSACWSEADRTKVKYGSTDDIKCAEDCAESGKPQALAVRDFDGNYKLYVLEEGKFVHKTKNWMAYIAQNVEVTGETYEKDGKSFLKVDAIKKLAVTKTKPKVKRKKP